MSIPGPLPQSLQSGRECFSFTQQRMILCQALCTGLGCRHTYSTPSLQSAWPSEGNRHFPLQEQGAQMQRVGGSRESNFQPWGQRVDVGSTEGFLPGGRAELPPLPCKPPHLPPVPAYSLVAFGLSAHSTKILDEFKLPRLRPCPARLAQ